jgi:hypothetical protein
MQISPKCKARKKISQRRIWMICKQEIFFRNAAVGMKYGFLEVPLMPDQVSWIMRAFTKAGVMESVDVPDSKSGA